MKTKIFTTMLMAAGLLITTSSFADGHFAQTHPRRDQVNDRLGNQYGRIDRKVDDGRMSRAEAFKLHREDHDVRMEERSMARLDHGHITRGDQRLLNHQENHISRQIYRH
ncbi:hypothetical protein [Dinghuibacter silviterrae]|uniref:Lipoprotein n=1 Tax=Dinghuibacter silviterrae TaxID=1539049 RepID=A0A4R8DN58_9BACT|nr:hypothetical protein [Dinghuibacter silviterrae]TDW99228.1 hypothetical protein EDB95_0237 [Dinghuibacter silviterrae]